MELIDQTDNIPATRNESDHLDIDTIRRRVAAIKSDWTEETVAARADEGKRRRAQLEMLILELLTDVGTSEEVCDLRQHGFSLVG